MKIVIWIGCIFAAALIQTAIAGSGMMLGAIPTALLFLGAMAAARALCRKWDEKHQGNDRK